jgi:hypothetical protein
LFYDRLGEAITNELVDWFNQVDAAYKSDLREMNELNFARFDAKLEQRLSELRAEMRMAIADLEVKLTTRIDASNREMMKFFLAAWVTQMVTLVGLVLGLYFK